VAIIDLVEVGLEDVEEALRVLLIVWDDGRNDRRVEVVRVLLGRKLQLRSWENLHSHQEIDTTVLHNQAQEGQ